MTLNIRKVVTHSEETFIEGGKAGKPVLMAGIAAVVSNPWHGAFKSELKQDISAFAPQLVETLVDPLIRLCGGKESVEAYGKAAVVGTGGEIEHASALIHTLRFGNPFREAAGGTAYLSFTNIRGPAGSAIMIPMTHKTDTGLRSHYITLHFTITDAPCENEIVVAIGAATGGRMHPRIGNRYEDMAEMGIKQPA
ncbi:amino acid synthesis family protein [Taklimakanibacter deserti]|uniref:amino acid synthesis family protein n=1 Tax=Taklimakanibacter deserti TaxID=2267839 RepID=UPI000E64C6C3